MQLVDHGPDIALALMAALEEGDLVLFCGAGVSQPAGLPLYGPFVDQLFEALTVAKSAADCDSLDRRDYDRVITTLVSRTDEPTVRAATCQLLRTPPGANLSTHRAIIALARSRDGRFRLVTTNFDDLFEESTPEIRNGQVMCAPRLPLSKPEHWNGLVHLHGHIADPYDVDRRHLVLTSGDFGAAYLTERWASRFVTHLFRSFTVLFVGYRVGDPVMRYLVDAIAAERRIDPRRAKQPYVFADCTPDSREQQEAQWRAGGIEPLLYDSTGGHEPLHATLVRWAELWSGGLTSRLNIIADLAPKPPRTLSLDIDIPRMLWALQEPSGAGTRHFADPETKASMSWLEVLGSDVPEHGNLLEGLVTRNTTNGLSLDPVKYGLAHWFANNLDDITLVRWIVASGGVLHPDFAKLVRIRLRSTPSIRPALRSFWVAVSGSLPIGRTHWSERFQDVLTDRLAHDSWDAPLRAEVFGALAPRITLRPPPVGELLEGEALRVPSFVLVECMPTAEYVWEFVLAPLLARHDWPSIAADIALDLATLLRRALDLQAAFDAASRRHDWSGLHAPRILPLDEDDREEDWTSLVELNRLVHQTLLSNSAVVRHALAGSWSQGPYPVFRRLTWYAFRVDGCPGAETLFTAVEDDPFNWIWSPFVVDEASATLGRLLQELPEGRRSVLDRIILSGPQPQDGGAPTDPDYLELRDRQVWRLLRALRATATLEAEAEARLSELALTHPDWTDADDSTESRDAIATGSPEAAAEAMDALSDEDVLTLLRDQPDQRTLDAWRSLLDRNIDRAARLVLELDPTSASEPWAIVMAVLDGRALSDNVDGWSALDFLKRVPNEIRTGHVRPVVDILRAVAKDWDDDSAFTGVLEVWDAIAPHTLAEPVAVLGDRLTTAINSAAGVIAEALLELLWKSKPTRGSGIPEPIKTRLTQLCNSQEPSAPLSRAMVMSRLYFLHEVDPSWTGAHLVPFLDWVNLDEAEGAWQGFLWSPRLGPSLWTKVKPHFLLAFDHLDRLGGFSEGLANLFAAVAIEDPDTLTSVEAAESLRKAGDEVRGSVAFWIKQRLDGAGDRAATLWNNQVGPWLARAWPVEHTLHGLASSRNLAWAAIKSGDAFQHAVKQVIPRIGSLARPELILHFLNETSHPQNHPDASLSLVDRIVGTRPDGAHGLTAFLDKVAQASSATTGRPEYDRLRDVARQVGG